MILFFCIRPYQVRLLSIGLVAMLLLAGCSLFGEEDTVIQAIGTVVLNETGEPLSNLTVTLESDAGGFGGHSIEMTTRTDANGSFAIFFDANGVNFGFGIRVSSADPFNPEYTGFYARVHPGETRDFGVIELSRIEP